MLQVNYLDIIQNLKFLNEILMLDYDLSNFLSFYEYYLLTLSYLLIHKVIFKMSNKIHHFLGDKKSFQI